MSNVIEIILVLSTCLGCSLSEYCVHHHVNTDLGSLAFKALQKIRDENFVSDLSQKMVTSSMKILAMRLFS